MTWAERAADASPAVQRSRARSLAHAASILDAARQLVDEKGDTFTTQELAKRAGVALQTFYRYFASKDQLLIAVIGEVLTEGCAVFIEQAQSLPGPLARLRHYVTAPLASLHDPSIDPASSRFVVSAHWQLQRSHPEEMAAAVKPFTDMLLTQIRLGTASGELHPADPERAAWFINELVRSVYHRYAFGSPPPDGLAEDLWQFCLAALGARPT